MDDIGVVDNIIDEIDDADNADMVDEAPESLESFPHVEIWTTWGAERQKIKFYKRMDKVWNRRLAEVEEKRQGSERGGETEFGKAPRDVCGRAE